MTYTGSAFYFTPIYILKLWRNLNLDLHAHEMISGCVSSQAFGGRYDNLSFTLIEDSWVLNTFYTRYVGVNLDNLT